MSNISIINADTIKQELEKLKNKEKAAVLQRFFKTGVGQYGEGDIFLGIVVPKQRIVANKYAHELSLDDIDDLLKSEIHEYRLTALFILVKQYVSLNKSKKKKIENNIDEEKNKEIEKKKKEICNFYLSHTKYINNWDLVDLSAPNIVGNFLLDKDNALPLLTKMANSKNLWDKRIAIMATFEFIKNKRHKETFAIADILLNDEHDLIHKAVGWMLREVGKRIDEKIEEQFLKLHAKHMPRTMLRYAIERFSQAKKAYYMIQKDSR